MFHNVPTFFWDTMCCADRKQYVDGGRIFFCIFQQNVKSRKLQSNKKESSLSQIEKEPLLFPKLIICQFGANIVSIKIVRLEKIWQASLRPTELGLMRLCGISPKNPSTVKLSLKKVWTKA